MRFQNRIISLLASSALMIGVTSSCGSSKGVTATSASKSHRNAGYEYVKIDTRLCPQEQALLSEAKKWLGTPYKYGGEDHNGVDCSALVLNVYRDALKIKLPRSSRQQFEYADAISRRDLIPGDLIFFATTRGSKAVSHVGLYIGEMKMIHASASSGVMVSNINDDYFQRTFVGAGRISAYYAMIDTKKQSTLKDSQAATQPLPFKFEPVASVPERKPVVIASVTENAPENVSGEISSADARRQVLNSIIEQKLDSIYSTAE